MNAFIERHFNVFLAFAYGVACTLTLARFGCISLGVMP